MIQIPGRIPIAIHPFFWITALLIGFFNSGGSIVGTLVWVGVIFVSVLIHELGHASTALFFGLKPRIDLVALGGLTTHRAQNLPYLKQFFIVLNGPLFGFGLFLIAWGLLKLPVFATGTANGVITLFYWVNLVWTVLNLVPVMPLDGGQLLRVTLEGFFGAKGFKYTLIVGMATAGILSLAFFFYQNFLIGALFFLFAYQSFDLFRNMRGLSEEDRSEHFKEALETAERKLQMGHKEEALADFERIYTESKGGMIHTLAAQYLAFLKYEQGMGSDTYHLLKPHVTALSPEALALLHKVALDEKDYPLVVEIGSSCFQTMPVKEVALRNAFASAALGQAKPAIGWLEAAFQDGLDNISEILKESYFDPIRGTTLFRQFEQMHSLT